MTEFPANQAVTKRQRKMAREPRLDGAGTRTAPVPADQASSPPAPAKQPSKSALVVELLQRAEGVTIEQLAGATGWLPHTTRAALTGLKKKGHRITSEKPADGPRIYRIPPGEVSQ